jgi:aminoglycoside/choline kinase family phosphotransferase
MLFVDWYIPHIAKIEINKTQISEFKKIWQELFSNLSKPTVLALRDYHADNLMLLKNRHEINKVGLLDFQDALIGHKGYDLVSLLEDARRDIDQDFRQEMIEYYITHSDCDRNQLLLDYKILSLQRNIKIIGIFSRLAIRDNKQNYLNFLPRVFNYVNSRLSDNYFASINQFLSNYLIINYEK